MFCSKCGTEVPDRSSFCPECGASLGNISQSFPRNFEAQGTRDQVKRSDLVYPRNPHVSPHMALLALILPGLPHIVFGQVAKGIAITVVFFLSMPTEIGPAIILIAALIDAYKVGNTLKAGKPVKQWEFFPSV